jgi:hypothetical protein
MINTHKSQLKSKKTARQIFFSEVERVKVNSACFYPVITAPGQQMSLTRLRCLTVGSTIQTDLSEAALQSLLLISSPALLFEQ